MNAKTAFLPVCLFAALPVYASAMEADADSINSYELDAVTVVATRATDNTPVAFSNLRRADIERVNTGRDIPFLLQMTPSVITTSDAGAGMGYTSMRIRGTDGNRINVMANDVPINDAESHRVYYVNMPDIASSLRDIQIQRGAGTRRRRFRCQHQHGDQKSRPRPDGGIQRIIRFL